MEESRREDIRAYAELFGVGERSIPCFHCNGNCQSKFAGDCFGDDFGLGLQTSEATIQITVAEDNASDN